MAPTIVVRRHPFGPQPTRPIRPYINGATIRHASVERRFHERHPTGLRPEDRRAVRRGHAALPKLAQDLRHGIAPGPARPHARGHADPDADQRGNRRESADHDLRYLGALHGPDGAHRSARRLDRSTQHLDPRARRHRATRRTHLGLRTRTPIRPEARTSALRAHPHAASSQAGAQRHPDALRTTRHRHARDGIRRHPREHASG